MAAPYETVEAQQGCFTTKQAGEVGYQFGSQAYHIKSGTRTDSRPGNFSVARPAQLPKWFNDLLTKKNARLKL